MVLLRALYYFYYYIRESHLFVVQQAPPHVCRISQAKTVAKIKPTVIDNTFFFNGESLSTVNKLIAMFMTTDDMFTYILSEGNNIIIWKSIFFKHERC